MGCVLGMIGMSVSVKKKEGETRININAFYQRCQNIKHNILLKEMQLKHIVMFLYKASLGSKFVTKRYLQKLLWSI